MKLLTIVGARPQFIKAAAFSNKLKSFPDIDEVIIHTGQHYENNMSKIFFDQLDIPKPDYLLNSGGKSHGEMIGSQIIEIEKILLKECPDYVIVYGDTNSTLSGALAASKLNYSTVHIEAGLRSYNMKMPEEINRILTDRLSKFLFCPSETAKKNLIKEGYEFFDSKVYVVGDIMLDAINLFIKKLKFKNPLNYPYIICTLHRQENIDDIKKFREIIRALNEISKKIKIVFPIHPRTRAKIDSLGLSLADNVIIKEPMSYYDFLNHINHCDLVITDSGGLQKEAYFMKKNSLIIREETEWTELVESNNNKLCGFKKETIVKGFNNRDKLNDSFDVPFYGGGNSSELIINILKDQVI